MGTVGTCVTVAMQLLIACSVSELSECQSRCYLILPETLLYGLNLLICERIMKNFVITFVTLVALSLGNCVSTFAQMIVAHRGASAEAPENSLSSFNLAWEQDANAIEGDFYLTADNQIVCIHDDTTERVSGVNLKVADSTLSQLRRLDVGSWKDERFQNERIPTLEQVLATIPFGKTLFFEIKCGPEILPHLKSVLVKSSIPSAQLKIISFNEEVIHVSKQNLPEFEAIWVVGFKKEKDHQRGQWLPTIDDVFETAKQIDADGLDLKAELEVITAEFVARARDAGFSLHAWTVDDPVLAKELQRLGFDSITTNRPGFIAQALAESEQSTVQPQNALPEANEPSSNLQSAGAK